MPYASFEPRRATRQHARVFAALSASEIERGLAPTWTPRRLGALLARADTNAYALVSATVDSMAGGPGRDEDVGAREAAPGGAARDATGARSRERCAGFSIASFGDDRAHLVLHAIAPGLRRAGYGRQLLDWQIHAAMVAGIRAMTLELRSSNTAALAFYRALGFEIVERQRGYYQGREDAWRMRLEPLRRLAPDDGRGAGT